MTECDDCVRKKKTSISYNIVPFFIIRGELMMPVVREQFWFISIGCIMAVVKKTDHIRGPAMFWTSPALLSSRIISSS